VSFRLEGHGKSGKSDPRAQGSAAPSIAGEGTGSGRAKLGGVSLQLDLQTAAFWAAEASEASGPLYTGTSPRRPPPGHPNCAVLRHPSGGAEADRPVRSSRPGRCASPTGELDASLSRCNRRRGPSLAMRSRNEHAGGATADGIPVPPVAARSHSAAGGRQHEKAFTTEPLLRVRLHAGIRSSQGVWRQASHQHRAVLGGGLQGKEV
jgi:hypothetical protein